MVTARLAVGSVSTLALGALLFGSAPYWMNRGSSHGTPWGAISSLSIGDPAAAQSDTQRAELLKLAALKSTVSGDQPNTPPAPPVVDTAPAQQATAHIDPAPPVVEAPPTVVPVPEAAPAPVQLASAEEPTGADTAAASVDATPKAGNTININTAPLSALDHMPGAGRIGHAIVSHRPYKSVKDLVNKRVLRMSDFQKIQSRISVD